MRVAIHGVCGERTESSIECARYGGGGPEHCMASVGEASGGPVGALLEKPDVAGADSGPGE